MPTRLQKLAKEALDTVIQKARVHHYKPIQIAEILFRHRNNEELDLSNLESYRNTSKSWRDEVSLRLVGRKSTSSQKYQDNIFEENAMPPRLLVQLGEMNRAGGGFVEAYIYKALQSRLSSVREVEEYIKSSDAGSFSINTVTEFFTETPGLRRSIDKIYEILVYALFSAIVRVLETQVTLEIGNKDERILEDFNKFIKMVLGIDAGQTKMILLGALYRAGVTNAADKGLDIWANFGPVVQVKYLTLSEELVEDIAESMPSDKIVIVCLRDEQGIIANVFNQAGFGEGIQGIITIDDLDDWYKLCLNEQYRATLGMSLLEDILREFEQEFPSNREIERFIAERGYSDVEAPPNW